ncbi:hypothetical protein [Ralstonia chuxiongensis]|uniref:Uncharacterized protein n=1 Tax=Ralstonia chuxiongensis TaxID=2957504 RepID=A0AA41WSL3_9RALS|nr:hypothetical protein [Ralstonia chuxiongensis]MCP1173751.1 hypothetical protein [Ralstonia chuxiongensis]
MAILQLATNATSVILMAMTKCETEPRWRMEMRDSEIACDSCGLTMGESRKLATLRAQADARPAGHFFKASRVHPWVQVEKECPNAVPLYTHPEASAPGLSDDVSSARAALIGLANHVRAVPAYSKLLGDMEQVDKAIAILTRASAQSSNVEATGLSDDEITDVWIKHGGPLNGNNFHSFARAILTRASAATAGETSNAEGPEHLCPQPAPGLEFDERVVLVYPIDKWVLMLLAAGAQVRNLGDVRWLATEDGSQGKGTGRHIACFILDGAAAAIGESGHE